MHAIPPELQEMLIDYKMHGEKKYTSDFWIRLNNLHINELLINSYNNFKHTIASYYFTYLLEPVTSEEITCQLRFLTNNLNEKEISYAKELTEKLPTSSLITKEFNTITLLLWQYLKSQGFEKELARLSEPLEGSPPAINFEGRLISQDLANSLLEFDTIRKHTKPDSIRIILEIGAGYGRSAYVWLRLSGVQKYVIVDVPPALYISQRYLSSQFPEKKVFRYRNFKSFSEVENEYNRAELVFLMPWQIELLPKKIFDLIFAIDSLNEMRLDTIKLYFKIIKKLGGRYFYMKSGKEWESDGVAIKREDWPIPKEWKKILERECRVQTTYLELLYNLL